MMIDLVNPSTPEDVRKAIINSFVSQDPYKNKGKVLPYLIAKNCRNLIDVIQEFI